MNGIGVCCGFNLDAQQLPVMLDDENRRGCCLPKVCLRGVRGRRASHESQFCPLTAHLAAFDIRSGKFHDFLDPIKNAAPEGAAWSKMTIF